VCAVSLCALVQVLLGPVGRGNMSPCFADGANDWDSAIMSPARVTFEHSQVLP
jgi:hypothetical protein